MSIQTPTRPPRQSPASHIDGWALRHGILRPPAELPADVTGAQLLREFTRIPVFLWLPFSVAILSAIAMQSLAAALPVCFVLASAASFHALHCARNRAIERLTQLRIAGLVPMPRAGEES